MIGRETTIEGERMETLIADYLSKLEFGELQSFKNMGVIPPSF